VILSSAVACIAVFICKSYKVVNNLQLNSGIHNVQNRLYLCFPFELFQKTTVLAVYKNIWVVEGLLTPDNRLAIKCFLSLIVHRLLQMIVQHPAKMSMHPSCQTCLKTEFTKYMLKSHFAYSFLAFVGGRLLRIIHWCQSVSSYVLS